MANQSIRAAFDKMWQHVVAKLGDKANVDHNHNDMYYTESEVDSKISAVNTNITNITNGSVIVKEAEHATNADIATTANTATSATKATQDGNGKVISSTYETKVDAQTKLDEAKAYADSASTAAATKVKNDLLNGAGGAYDTLKELGDLIDTNVDAIEALETVASGKADKVHGHEIADVSGLQTTLDEISLKANESATFVVNITENEDGSFSADKTFAEITEAYESGKVVVCQKELVLHYSAGLNEQMAIFNFTQFTGGSLSTQLIVISLEDEVMFACYEEVLFELNTTNKSIVGAINEVHSELDSHNHDGRYYTESEINAKLATVNSSIDNIQTAVEDTKTFFVTATTTDMQTGTKDKTYNEILDAYNNGQAIYCKLDLGVENTALVCPLTGFEAGDFLFTVTLADILLATRISADNTISFEQLPLVGLDNFENHANDASHITYTERTNWGAAYTHSQATHAPSNAQANQNAFSNVKVGTTTIAADTTTDTLELVGSNVTITPDATNDKVTIAVADGTTSAKGIVKLTNSTSSTSTTTAATPSSVKSAYDLANTAKTNAATAQSKADSAYSLAEGKVDSLSDLGITATAAELNYVDGVTSSIQTQLNNKRNLSDTWINNLDFYNKNATISFYDTVTANTGGSYPVYAGKAAAQISYGSGTLNVSKGSLQVGGTNVSVDGHTHNALYHGSTSTAVMTVFNGEDDATKMYITPPLAVKDKVYLGASNNPWEGVYADSMFVGGTKVDGRRLYLGEEAIVGVDTTNTSGVWSFVPSTHTNEDMQVALGTTSNPFYKVNTDRLEVLTSKPLFPFIGSNGSGSTVTYAPNTYVNSSGIFSRTTHANSSKTIKTDIDELKDESINAERLYDLDVVQFKYDNDKINISEDDYRYGKLLPGFIIENLIEKYPIAVDKETEDAKDWRWNSQFLVPAMLKLIQDQKKEIDSLREDINVLKETVNK